MNHLSSLTACMSPCSTMKATPQDGGFQVRYNLIPPKLVSNVFGVFSNRAQPSHFWRKPMATEVAYVTLEISLVSLKNSKGDSL